MELLLLGGLGWAGSLFLLPYEEEAIALAF